MEWLKGKKTYFLVAFGVLSTLVQLISGDVSLIEFFNSSSMVQLLTILGIGTARAGMKKGG